jgi:ADP-ribose pyrophosphatase
MGPSADLRWKVRNRHSEMRRQPWLEVFKESIELPDGRTVDDFYSVDMQDFVVVVAVTSANEVVVESLYRHGAGRVTYSMPAGYVHAGEEPLDAAKRELREETGYEASTWMPLGRFIVDGNRGCGWCSCFLARDAGVVAKPESDDLAEVGLTTMSLASLLDLAAEGKVAELASVAALALASVRLTTAGANGH